MPDDLRKEAPALGRAEADLIVSEASATYFLGCRERIGPFVDATFSLGGSTHLHRHAIGWDLVKAPLNVTLAVPQIAMRLGSAAARRVGAERTAKALDREIFLDTAVARELRWRIMTDLLRLPFQD